MCVEVIVCNINVVFWYNVSKDEHLGTNEVKSTDTKYHVVGNGKIGLITFVSIECVVLMSCHLYLYYYNDRIKKVIL